MNKFSRLSLTRIFTLAYFFVTIVPLFLLTFIFVNQFRQTIGSELSDRLKLHLSDVQDGFSTLYETMESRFREMEADPQMIPNLMADSTEELSLTLKNYFYTNSPLTINVYGITGKHLLKAEGLNPLKIEFFKDQNETLDKAVLENKNSYISRAFFEKNGNLTLSVIKKFTEPKNDSVVGYIEQRIVVDTGYLNNLKENAGIEIVFFDRNLEEQVSTLKFSSDKRKTLPVDFLNQKDEVFDYLFANKVYAFLSGPLSWGERDFLMGIGLNKDRQVKVFSGFNVTLLFALIFLLGFLLLSYFYLSKQILMPIKSLIESTKDIEQGKQDVKVNPLMPMEIKHLVEQFNAMSGQISKNKTQLENKVIEIQNANERLQKTHIQLVQSAKLAGLGELVAGIAHELNNPIGFIYNNVGHLEEYSNALINLVDELSKTSSNSKSLIEEYDFKYIANDFPKLIASCKEGATRVKEIVTGLRNFSRSDNAGREEFDLHQGIDSTIKLLSGEIKNRIKIHRQYNQISKINVHPGQINQVIMNLLTNAAQAIPTQGNIWIETGMKDGKVFFSVKDDGIGIKPENIDKIFDPFYTTKPVGEGTGLGLSVSYGIIQAHQGEIKVETAPGKGTKFIIFLPS